MIASLAGTVKSIGTSSLVIDVGGVGYLVFANTRVLAGAQIGATITVATTLVVREDAMTLYGFESMQSREIFELLQSVSGIGPKVAQSALGVYDPAELTHAIANEDAAALERIPGLGKKGAQRVVLELKDKVAGFASTSVKAPRSAQPWRDQLLLALVGLGFTARDANARIDLVASDVTEPANAPLPDLLRAALASSAHS